MEKINYDISLGACKGPPTLEVGRSMVDESSPSSDNSRSEAKNDCAKEIYNL